ncbi:MAG: hypothetical protein KDB00_01180 [Planctomycetales bacterium]|nr:hypothetical protein [Planctomycetales bacterium]
MPNYPDFRCHTEAMGLVVIIFGLLAMWIALGAGRWFVRVAMGIAFLGLLVPMKAYQPIFFFSVSAAATVLVLSVARRLAANGQLRRRLRRTEPPARKRMEFWLGILLGVTVAIFVIGWAVREFWAFGILESMLVFVLVVCGVMVAAGLFGERFRFGPVVVETVATNRWRFQLSDIMFGIVLLAVVFALDSYCLVQAPIRLWREFFATVGILTLINVAATLVVVTVRNRWRLMFVIVLLATLGSTFMVDFGAGNWLMQLSVLGPTRGAPWGKIVLVYVMVLLCAAQMTRMGGWLQFEESGTPFSDATKKLARVMWFVTAAVFVACLLPIGLQMSRRIGQPDHVAGDPLVFDALAEQARAVTELNPYGKRMDELRAKGATEKADFIADSNSRIRQLSRQPFRLPETSDVPPGVNIVGDNLVAIRGWTSIALSEANHAKTSERFVDAADWAMDCVWIGSGLSSGGDGVHTLSGIGIETAGQGVLVGIQNDLPTDRLERLLVDLIVVDHGRERIESLELREHHSMVHWMGWRYRLAQSAPPVLSAERAEDVRTLATPALEATKDSIDRRDATHRLLMVEMAIALFRQRAGRFPVDLAELVPDFLASIPIDPYSDKPLIYRIEGDGYVMYSTGTDGDDDGGSFGDSSTLYDDTYDFDVNTMFRPQRTPGFGGIGKGSM